MLRTAASFTMALEAVGDPRVESSGAGLATLCAESSCGCKMPTAPHDDLVALPDFREHPHYAVGGISRRATAYSQRHLRGGVVSHSSLGPTYIHKAKSVAGSETIRGRLPMSGWVPGAPPRPRPPTRPRARSPSSSSVGASRLPPFRPPLLRRGVPA